jgi:hypothetical protein
MEPANDLRHSFQLVPRPRWRVIIRSTAGLVVALLAFLGFQALNGQFVTPRPYQKRLLVPLHGQKTIMWCWAASGEMIMEYLGKRVEQCDQANHRFSSNACCGRPVPVNPCINGGWPDFSHYGFSADQTTDQALSWEDLCAQIDNHRPIAFTWHWRGGGGHMMVAIGHAISDNERWVLVHDPLPVGQGETKRITYENYVSGSDHTHWNDYYNITRIP